MLRHVSRRIYVRCAITALSVIRARATESVDSVVYGRCFYTLLLLRFDNLNDLCRCLILIDHEFIVIESTVSPYKDDSLRNESDGRASPDPLAGTLA